MTLQASPFRLYEYAFYWHVQHTGGLAGTSRLSPAYAEQLTGVKDWRDEGIVQGAIILTELIQRVERC